MVSLYVNVDHVATLRQQRGTRYPDPAFASVVCELAGADGITVHLREDRRHIQERDVRVLRQIVQGTFNLEMAATEEMLGIAEDVKPDFCTLVPERREERTTEGGLQVKSGGLLADVVKSLRRDGIGVSLFIDPEPAVVRASAELGASTVELHTGYYCNAARGSDEAARELGRLHAAAHEARAAGLRLAAGHGLDTHNVGPVAGLPHLEELNIGHGLVAQAVMVGLERAVADMRKAIDAGVAAARR